MEQIVEPMKCMNDTLLGIMTVLILMLVFKKMH